MFWFAIPAIVVVGKLIYDAVKDDPPPPRRKSNLELNFERLESQLRSHQGPKIAILGQIGAGKSSLLKKMTKSKIIPLPVIGLENDATDWSRNTACNLIGNFEKYVFADVPGYDTDSHPTHVFTSYFPFSKFDIFIFVVKGKLHSADQNIFRLISQSGKWIFVAKSFSESLEPDEMKSVEIDIRKNLSLSRYLQNSNFTKPEVRSVLKF